jgi:hypothetical protein
VTAGAVSCARAVAALGWAAAALAACGGNTGVISVSIVSAPDVDPLEGVVRVRLAIDDPPAAVERERRGDGSFDLTLDLVAEGQTGRLTFEGFDGDGRVLAVGRSAPLPISAVDAAIVLFVAAPHSVSRAPADLPAGRREVSATALPSGALWAGGADDQGAPATSVAVYNLFTHQVREARDLPSPRSQLIAAAGSADMVYLFGGRDETGQASPTLWWLDTAVRPGGAYTEFAVDAAFARAGGHMLGIGGERFVITGGAPLVLSAAGGAAAALPGPNLSGPAVSLQGGAGATGGQVLVIGLGTADSGAALFDGAAFHEIPAPPEALRTGHAAAVLDDGSVLVVGGELDSGLTTTALRWSPRDGSFAAVAELPRLPRRDAAVARAGTRLLIAGGSNAAGDILADIEVYDATDLSPLPGLTLAVPRTGASATALANGQVLISGGVGAAGAAVTTLELFTP